MVLTFFSSAISSNSLSFTFPILVISKLNVVFLWVKQKYIKFEESSGDPARVQVLYERAVSELPVSSDIWMGYTSYLDRTLKVLLKISLAINVDAVIMIFFSL